MPLPNIKMARKTSSSYDIIKNQFINGKRGVVDLKAEIRKQFKAKIKTIRNNEYDERRKTITKRFISEFLEESMHDMQNDFLKNYDSEFDEQAIINIINEVQEEVIQLELNKMVEEHEKEEESNLESILNIHLVTCNVCDKFTEPQCDKDIVICSECAERYFAEDKL